MGNLSTKVISLMLACGIFLTGCGDASDKAAKSSIPGEKILKVSETFALETLNAHKDYIGWYTSIYGVTETLFVMNDQAAIEPKLAESYKVDGKVWTIQLKNNITFSNGNVVTPEIVIKNLKDVAASNTRYAYLSEYEYTVVDDTTFTITTTENHPTLINDLASAEVAIIDLDASGDMSNDVIGTGPFVVSSFTPGGTVEVKKNVMYWDGDVKLDGAVFYYMPDADTSLMAMQNNELDTYSSVSADAKNIFELTPDMFSVVTVPANRLQFCILNENRLNDTVRKAINLTINSKEMEAFLSGTVSTTDGPFKASSAYGKVMREAVNTEQAKALLEQDGYSLNAEGYYEKDGKVLSLEIAYYAARNLDTVATLIQEQLRRIGVNATLTAQEDPDSTYVATGEFDIALYCMISDKAGDPYEFISATLSKDGLYNCGGFSNAEVQEKIEKMASEMDIKKRAELANEIIQTAVDENTFNYLAVFNRTTVMKKGVSNVSETSPYDYYFLTKDSDKN
ncbi:MAG: ABC transporter substrate-binding protein [bacterium]|nr:ABC transporter substrate-binding protein [bacterium]